MTPVIAISIFHAMVVRVDRAPLTSVVVGIPITLAIAGRERVLSTSWRSDCLVLVHHPPQD